MKLKLKALAAAVVLAAAGPALADIQAGNNNNSSQNGEVVFFAYGFDASGNVATYVKDLGVAFNTFVSTPGYVATDLDSDANWTTFKGANLTGANWGVFATQKTGTSVSTAAGAFRILTTATGNDVSGISVISNASALTAFNNANQAISAINVGGTDYAANNSYFFAPAPVDGANPSGNLGAYLGSDFATSGVFFGTTNAVGTTTTAQFFNVERGAGTNAAGVPTAADIDGASAYWTFDANNVLSYQVAAVPEPETYGLMAGGLLMLGAIARRRKA